ncbi:tetratricopeptide repeat protein [Pseudomonas sp. EA_105y_Pfl2_R69]|uniref:tetratricopeptide repeat protein n=1 Tax=Pseudomonas sp. EA_105y_Pfl2_R69 TaxID=3088683 RepID=UPI0030D97894
MQKRQKNKTSRPSTVPIPSSGYAHFLWPILAGLALLATLAIWVLLQRSTPQPSAPTIPSVSAPAKIKPETLALVDESQCQGCHAEPFKQWQGSHHQLAMQEANSTTVLGDFNEVNFKSDKESTRFFRQGDEFWVNTPGTDGHPADFRVAYAFGVEPLQQYLIETGGGHLQALGVAWDTQKNQWFHLYPGLGVDFKDPLHWSKPQQNANFMCVECHTTGFKRNFDAASNTYSSTWQALGVGCQSCHGPASGHLKWNEQPDNLANAGFLISAKTMDARTEVETCARCHARRAPLGDGFRDHMRLMDDYLPSTLAPLLYEIDGKINDEVFEYGSLVQSKMYAKGVTCSDCHNPHSTELRIEGNGTCTQCHNPAGKSGRPGIDGKGLLAKDYESPEHHKHPADSSAAQCTSCHMPGKLYMVNDYRHDHSFSIPNPARSLKLGTPDACLSCHRETASEKVVAQFQQWYGKPAATPPRYDESLWLIRHGKPGAAKALFQQLESRELPAIRRASLLAELPNYPSQKALQLAVRDLKHIEPQVRESAIDAIAQLLPQPIDLLGPMLADPVLAVRIAAAYALLGLPADQLDRYQSNWSKAIAEYEQVQLSQAERAEANFNLAMLYQADGRTALVETYLRTALKRDADFFPALVALAQWLEDNFQKDEARQLLQDAVRDHPHSALLQHAHGLALVRDGNRQQALLALREATRLEPENGQFGYVLAIALYDSDQAKTAIQQLEEILERQPGNRNVRLALVNYLQQAGQADKAQNLLAELAELNPMDPLLKQ